ncbi:hypothetical protein CHS0354_007485 [Potamilus streckersoni]|uniref:Acylphosphatase n=1 Tax=Potamilus streckersoni TaxID=2493646 RepID=A0AAE0SWV7_9BIVA|nr:hypothetical protein CHS0354_007485 [Potamilus streckersoni]
MATRGKYLSVDYEVFGKVQGVFFRKHTQKKAKELGLVGWVKNTASGTVVGQVQGLPDKVSVMKNWLQKVGSPKSKIERCVFPKEETVEKMTHKSFKVVE